MPAHLPQVELIIESASTLCSCGCRAMTKIGEDVSKRLDVIAAQWPEVSPSRAARSPAIPDRPDRRPRPARPEAPAIVAAAAKAGTAEIVPLAIPTVVLRNRVNIPVASVGAREPTHRFLLLVERNAVAQRLAIAWQEAVTLPDRLGPLLNWRSVRDDRQQRHDDSSS